MKRALVVGIAMACLLGLCGSAFAEINAIDGVPAATLLLPYFEVDLLDLGGVTTLFSINNASATAILAHVTLWTNESVPTLDFDIYLTGYDVQSINLQDIFVRGDLPITASDGQDPGDTADPNDGISNQGVASQDINFASCSANLPLPPGFLDDGFLLPYIQAAHTGNNVNGQGLLQSGCYGFNLGDQIARGYITVDTTNSCSLLFPNSPGYFAPGGGGIATNQNVLWGDYFIVEPDQNFAFGDLLVHIEAGSTIDFVPGDYTFYGRYVAWNAADGREPLGAVWATRYLEGGGFDGGTDFIVWRDAKAASAVHSCVTVQPWFPLNQTQAVAFDERENPVEVCRIGGSRVSPPVDRTLTCFPLETQRVPARGEGLVGSPINVPFNFGWIFLNLNTTVTGQPGGLNFPFIAQSYVTTSMSAQGRFQVGFPGVVLQHASGSGDPIIPAPLIAPCPGPSCP